MSLETVNSAVVEGDVDLRSWVCERLQAGVSGASGTCHANSPVTQQLHSLPPQPAAIELDCKRDILQTLASERMLFRVSNALNDSTSPVGSTQEERGSQAAASSRPEMDVCETIKDLLALLDWLSDAPDISPQVTVKAGTMGPFAAIGATTNFAQQQMVPAIETMLRVCIRVSPLPRALLLRIVKYIAASANAGQLRRVGLGTDLESLMLTLVKLLRVVNEGYLVGGRVELWTGTSVALTACTTFITNCCSTVGSDADRKRLFNFGVRLLPLLYDLYFPTSSTYISNDAHVYWCLSSLCNDLLKAEKNATCLRIYVSCAAPDIIFQSAKSLFMLSLSSTDAQDLLPVAVNLLSQHLQGNASAAVSCALQKMGAVQVLKLAQARLIRGHSCAQINLDEIEQPPADRLKMTADDFEVESECLKCQSMGCSNRNCQRLTDSREYCSTCKACRGCFRAQYCCRECQIAAWPTHRVLCKRMQQMRSRSMPAHSPHPGEPYSEGNGDSSEGTDSDQDKVAYIAGRTSSTPAVTDLSNMLKSKLLH